MFKVAGRETRVDGIIILIFIRNLVLRIQERAREVFAGERGIRKEHGDRGVLLAQDLSATLESWSKRKTGT